MEHIIAKTATLAPHPILDTSNKEEYMVFLKKALALMRTLNCIGSWSSSSLSMMVTRTG